MKGEAFLHRVLLSSANMASTKGSHRHRHDVESDSAVETFPCYALGERTANTVVVDVEGPKWSWWLRRMPSRRRAKIALFLLLLVGAAIAGVAGLLGFHFRIFSVPAFECEAQSAAEVGDEAGQASLSASSAFSPGEWVDRRMRREESAVEKWGGGAETGLSFSKCFN